jgi:DMSO/TMAO reductase YedYZ molybdopterin-dependent catalytic subunit
MTLTRRAFIKLIPLGAAIGVVSWWFLKQKTQAASTGYVENTGSPQAQTQISSQTESNTGASSVASDFPVTWSVDHPTNVDPKGYRLSVDGDVSHPLQLTLDELYSMSSVSESQTIYCPGEWSAIVAWEGIPLSRLLSLAGTPSAFDHLTVESVTGYSMDLSQNDVAVSGTMIALKAGSAPLKVEHGYPARLVLPGKLGYEWVKYVARITCVKG